MKTNFLKLTALLGLVAISQSAMAQFDYFGQSRSLVVAAPTSLGATSTLVTNSPVNVKEFDGVARIDFSLYTNAACVVTAQIYTSPNGTNSWSALTNYALATASTLTITNVVALASGYTNGSALCTNNYLIPGVITTPTAATAGWAAPYVAPAQFTNQAAVTLNGQTITSIGFNISDCAAYLEIVWGTSGTATNAIASANLVAPRARRP